MASDATTVAPVAAQPVEIRRPTAGLWSDALWRLRHDPTTIAACVVIVTMIMLALGADLLADNFFHWSFTKQDILSSYEKPSLSEPAMWLGSDQLGRSH